jgi:hypothetical protein
LLSPWPLVCRRRLKTTVIGERMRMKRAILIMIGLQLAGCLPEGPDNSFIESGDEYGVTADKGVHHVPAIAGKVVRGVSDQTRWDDSFGRWFGRVGEIMQIPLELDQGDRLISASSRIIEVVDHVSMRLWRIDANSQSPSRTQIGATQTSVGGGLYETLTISGLAEDVPGGFVNYYVEFTVTNDGGGGVQVFGVTYDASPPTIDSAAAPDLVADVEHRAPRTAP